MNETTRRADRITVYLDTSDPPEWRWNRKAPNGEIVASSEGYTVKASAVEAAQREADGRADVIVEGE